ncbi:hypothetical protein GCM10023074_59910 [Microbispora amethystogenes]
MSQSFRVTVIYHTFMLVDSDGLGVVPAQDVTPLPARFTAASPNIVVIMSNFDTHNAEVVIEAWDEPPPLELMENVDAEEDIVNFSSGILNAATPAGGPVSAAIDLERPAMTWNLRVYRQDLYPDLDPGDESLDDVDDLERYLIQLWPTHN